MDPMDPEAGVPGGRARRAVPLIAAALTVAVVVGLLYLRPAPPRLSAAVPSPTQAAPMLAAAYVPSYDFVTPTLGWAVIQANTEPQARFWIFRTDDAGAHWRLQTQGAETWWTRSALTFFDRLRGVAVIGGTAAYATSDGGARWRRLTLPALPGADVEFTDLQHGWVVGVDPALSGKGGPPEVYRTTDGATTWQRMPDPPVGGIVFRGNAEGWGAVTDEHGRAEVEATWDGGQTWDRAPLPDMVPADGKGGYDAYVVLLPHSGVLAVVGFGAFVSFDHGSSWRELGPLPGGVDYPEIAFQDASHWWVMPFGNLYRSSDAGQTWQHIVLRLDEWNYHVGIIDSRHAWALLDTRGVTRPPVAASALALTSDGGLSWRYANVPNPV